MDDTDLMEIAVHRFWGLNEESYGVLQVSISMKPPKCTAQYRCTSGGAAMTPPWDAAIKTRSLLTSRRPNRCMIRSTGRCRTGTIL